MVLDMPVLKAADESAEQLFHCIIAIWQEAKLHMPTQEQLQQEIHREKSLMESLREKQS